jgi:hypothetical protein
MQKEKGGFSGILPFWYCSQGVGNLFRANLGYCPEVAVLAVLVPADFGTLK